MPKKKNRREEIDLSRVSTPGRKTSITTPAAVDVEETDTVEQSGALRPKRLSEFKGQKKATEWLDIAIDAAKKRGDVLDHVLLHGPPGLGKTTLGYIIAQELGGTFKNTSGPVLEKPGDLVSLLTNLKQGDVLFIDEIHRLKPVIEEFLYSAMEDFRVDIRLEQGSKASTVSLDLEPFTLIGATTRFGLLTPPMRARFGIVERLKFYDYETLGHILKTNANKLGLQYTSEGMELLARRARGTPRIANRLLRRVRDFAQIKADNKITLEVTEEALSMLGVDSDGLDEMDLRLLRVLVSDFGGRPVGLGTLAVALGEDEGTIEEVYEPFLVRQGYLKRTPRGREPTRKAAQKISSLES